MFSLLKGTYGENKMLKYRRKRKYLHSKFLEMRGNGLRNPGREVNPNQEGYFFL